MSSLEALTTLDLLLFISGADQVGGVRTAPGAEHDRRGGENRQPHEPRRQPVAAPWPWLSKCGWLRFLKKPAGTHKLVNADQADGVEMDWS